MGKIRLRCPRCGKKLSASDDKAGRTGRCPKCGAVVPVPFEAPVAQRQTESSNHFARKLVLAIFVPFCLALAVWGAYVFRSPAPDALGEGERSPAKAVEVVPQSRDDEDKLTQDEYEAMLTEARRQIEATVLTEARRQIETEVHRQIEAERTAKQQKMDSAGQEQPLPGPQIARAARPSIVELVLTDVNGKAFRSGSGFFVRKDVVATNFHVIRGAAGGYAKIIGRGRKYALAGHVGIDRHNDLALVKVRGAKAPLLPLGNMSEVAQGDKVYVFSNPEGFEGTFSSGIVSAIRRDKGKTRLQMDAAVSPGSSGGPVLDRQGKVIGVAVEVWTGGQNLNFAVPVRHLSVLLSEIKPVRPFPRYVLRVRTLVDGRSSLMIFANCVYWFHLQWQVPGRTTINGCEWLPKWEKFIIGGVVMSQSSDFFMLPVPLPPIGKNKVAVRLKKIAGRGRVTAAIKADIPVIEVEIYDPQPGADWYEFEVEIRPLGR